MPIISMTAIDLKKTTNATAAGDNNIASSPRAGGSPSTRQVHTERQVRNKDKKELLINGGGNTANHHVHNNTATVVATTATRRQH